MRPFSIYIHIPFCLSRCPYCDFNSYALNVIPEKDYVAALLCELDYRASLDEWCGRTVETIYFGGGTPSLFKPSSMHKIMAAICARFPVAGSLEVSMEANPNTVDADSLLGYREAGINRLSLGAQTLDPDLLKTLGRIHSVEQIEAACAAAKGAGFTNLNLDLIYGIPTQTLEQVRADLKQIMRLDPQHVSAYGLTIEKGTSFYSQYKKGLIKLPSEEEVVSMMNEISSFLSSCGYKRYEISNFAERGFEARHNLTYWNGGDYLGLGAGAHSFLASYKDGLRHSGVRWANYALPNKYCKQAAATGEAQSWSESLSTTDLMFEFFFLGLRKINGVSCSEFEALFGTSIDKVYPALLEVLADQNLLKRNGDFLALSEEGLLIADSVIENFAAPEGKVIKFPRHCETGTGPTYKGNLPAANE